MRIQANRSKTSTSKALFSISALFLMSVSSLSSCNQSKFLDKPNNTNLEFWITEKVEREQLKDCTYLPGSFGASLYLDSRYDAITSNNANSINIAPDVHVTYLLSAYPDYSDGGLYVTSISITDPTINVYGLTMASRTEDIISTMTSIGFSKGAENRYSKNNCVFTFRESEIIIGAEVTNKKGINF